MPFVKLIVILYKIYIVPDTLRELMRNRMDPWNPEEETLFSNASFKHRLDCQKMNRN